MKKKLISMQHWLNRLTVAYSKNELTSAMAEADSLSAELEGVRDELWDRVEDETIGHSWKKIFTSFACHASLVLLVSFFIICVSIRPINHDTVTTISKTQDQPVAQKPKGRPLISLPATVLGRARKIARKTLTGSNQKQAAVISKAKTQKAKEEPKPSEVLATLVQVGEQNLHDNTKNKFIIKKDKKLQSKERSL